MIKFGIHCLIWADKWSNDALDLIDKARNIGFGAFEIYMGNLEAIDPQRIRERLKANDIEGIASAAIPKEADITNSDPKIREKGIEILKRTVRIAAAMGSNLVTGVIYSPWSKLVGRGPTQDEINWSADALREVAKYAKDFGVRLGIEPVNRYETYLVNTAEQALYMVQLIGEPNVGVHLDTYHMNIEEKNFFDPVIYTGKDLIHFHVCENDRGIPGSGNVDWDGLFKALAQINYSGIASIESFVLGVSEIAASTCVWRQLAPSGDILAREGLAFLKAKANEYGLKIQP